jgi:hypothetical protein
MYRRGLDELVDIDLVEEEKPGLGYMFEYK